MFASNVQPKKKVAEHEAWQCSHCKIWNAGASYSCSQCLEGRRPKR